MIENLLFYLVYIYWDGNSGGQRKYSQNKRWSSIIMSVFYRLSHLPLIPLIQVNAALGIKIFMYHKKHERSFIKMKA